ncbi:hypothetical protein KEM55_009201, partial [Ascosphaera atra]
PMVWPDKITVYSKLTANPYDPQATTRTSFSSDVVILSEKYQRPAARVSEENTLYDYRRARKAQGMPPFLLDQFRVLWDLQEESRRAWWDKAGEIERRVRRLEQNSWDREGAVEDLGSSA